jgi:type IV pilus assembly protein PilZ
MTERRKHQRKPVAEFGAQVNVYARLPGQAEEMTLPGVVRWATPKGFGVQFGLLGARVTHALVQFLHPQP